MVIAYLKLLLFSSENASVLSRGYLVAVEELTFRDW